VSEDVLVWNGRAADPAPSKRVAGRGLEDAAGQGVAGRGDSNLGQTEKRAAPGGQRQGVASEDEPSLACSAGGFERM
jgi:hypothetical protein